MSKWGLAGTSLAAAIPGGILFFMLLMAVLNSFEPMPMILKVVSIATLVMALTMGLFPLYAVIYGPSSAGAPSKKKETPTGGDDEDVPTLDGDDDVEEMEDVAETGEFSSEEVEAFEEEFDEEFDDEFDSEEASGDEDFDSFDDDLEGDFDDEFEFEEFDEDDDR